ncbi:hypothetical protein BROUX41_003488 [Berkeleyomyces rouxiae]|uniref:uncharacterized protein n=1 Tax=Berkeleyomyces rouxiae TaxID=2035830 RepID=UPI003B7769A1
MARTTRSTKTSAAAAAKSDGTGAKASSKVYTLPPAENPRRIFILPRKATPDARIVTLRNPRSGSPTRYYACPETGLYEFTQVSSPDPRSWLAETPASLVAEENKEPEAAPSGQLTTISDADLFVATTIDPVFHLISALYKQTSKDEKRRYLSADDQLDEIPSDSSHLWNILKWPGMRKIFEERLAAICETADLVGERMYCLDDAKLFDLVLSKAKRLAKNGLPASMEDKFVTKILEAPMVFKAAPPGAVLGTDGDETAVSSDLGSEVVDSKESAEAKPASPSTDSFSGGVFVESKIPQDMLELQRLSVAFKFICANYIPASIEASLKKLLNEKVDFKPLEEYLKSLTKSRADAVASRSSDMSRKHPLDDAEDRLLEKKRKTEEEAKKKKLVSRGVRDLQKVNTTGMKKLSHFFKKA